MPRKGQVGRTDEERLMVRRELVQQYFLQGLTYRAMGALLEVSPDTIKNDVAWIKQNWREKMAAQYDDMRAKELAKLDALEQAMWPEAMKGRPHVVERVLGVMDHRAKIMGLYAPTQSKVQVITDDMLDALIAKKEAELRELTAGRTESIEAGEVEGTEPAVGGGEEHEAVGLVLRQT